MEKGKCAIWGTDCDVEPSSGFYSIHDSPRAGGRYKINDGARHLFESNYSDNAEFKAKLTTWLVNQRRSGVLIPEFPKTTDFFQSLENGTLLRTSDRVDGFFHYLYSINLRPSAPAIKFETRHSNAILTGVTDEQIYAFTESIDWEDFQGLFYIMREAGYLTDYGRSSEVQYHLLPKGWDYYNLVNSNRQTYNQAFVAMWFNSDDHDTFENGIKPAIEKSPDNTPTGFKAFRVDKEHHTDFIMDFMIGNIKRSKFMVADFTSFAVETKEGKAVQIPRGGVYYEAGFAQGLGIPVIATCRKDQKDHIHFDLQQFNTIYWKDVADLRKQLSERIFGMFVS